LPNDINSQIKFEAKADARYNNTSKLNKEPKFQIAAMRAKIVLQADL